ncbi:MAG: ABC transporter permease, partial [Aquabacterium sp.]
MSYELPYEWRVGWRYTRAGRAGRRNGFISFISFISIVGIALGVAALIIVLSVMNGFQKEVRDRMLSVVAHVELSDPDGLGIPDWRALAREAGKQKQVVGAAPFISQQVLVARGDRMQGAIVRGIDPQAEPDVTPVAAELKKDGLLDRLQPDSWGVILGSEMASQLGVHAGDPITIVTPNGQVTPTGVLPRMKRVTVLGTFTSGHYEYDAGLALMRLEDMQRLFRVDGPTGVQLRLQDLQQARAVGNELTRQFAGHYLVRDWTRT